MAGNYTDLYRPLDSEFINDTTSVGSDESLQNTAGPNLIDNANHLLYEKQERYTAYDATPLVSTTKQEAPKMKDFTSLFLIDSKNRDKNAFAQPTAFTLMPPRVYKNVASIQVTQIKLLSSFFYFSASKANTFLPLIETGRIEINSYLDNQLTASVIIREGTYGINDLLTELQTQMNYTPYFYDFPGVLQADGSYSTSFSEFVNNFTINGDLSVNFNQPGDTYYDSLNKKFIQNPTINTITGYYWGSRYAGLLEYSIDQVKVAYYYPVLYEAVLDLRVTLNLDIPQSYLSSGESAYSHILFNSSGLNDKAVIYLINQNIPILDDFRLKNTFRYYPVNRYQVAYDTNSLRVNIISLSLNTSLVNLINTNSATSLATILNTLGITATEYSNLSANLNRARVVYGDMYNFIQSKLTTYFAIPYATYASQYFNSLANTLYVQNGLNAVGIRSGYTAEYLTSGSVPISSMAISYSNSPGYWPNFNLSTTVNGNPVGGFLDSEINLSTSMIPYNVLSKNFQFGLSLVDPSTFYIQTNKSSRSVDLVATIEPAKYTVFKFKSSARQTLQVETLPLPYYYRFAEYNKQGLYKGVLDTSKKNVPQKYFDLSYSFLYLSTNMAMDSANYSTLVLSNAFGQSLDTSFLTAPLISMNSQRNLVQLEFTAPYPQGLSTGLVSYVTSLSFTPMANSTPSTLFTDNFDAFLYHDRAVFMADIQIQRNENPLHYIQSARVSSGSPEIIFNISTFAGHTYYAIFRSDQLAFSNTSMKPFVYYNDATYTQIQTDYVNFDPTANPYAASNASNYPFVTNYSPDFLRLPVQSTIQGVDPSNSTFATAVIIGGLPIGCDISGVSNDLTDYMGYTIGSNGFIPTTSYRVDPLSQYIFRSLSPFNPYTNTYFSSTSQNQLLTPGTNNPYTFQGTSSVQLKIVHWYDGYSIPKQLDDAFTTFQTISTATCSSISQVLGAFPTNSSGEIQLGRGINAIGFAPVDGLYEVSSFTFKSVIYPLATSNLQEEDPNSQIKNIGIFSGLYLAGNIIQLSNALSVLSFRRAVVYSPSTSVESQWSGTDYGTFYEYSFDSSFVASSNVNISGYTPGSSDLLSFNSMYYMVPFNSKGESITFSRLAGSVVPYPLAQIPTTASTFLGQVTTAIAGVQTQPIYVVPSTLGNANPAYGPAAGISQYQSQYEQSMPITTTSLGYKEYGFLVTNSNSLYPFQTSFTNSGGLIPLSFLGLTTHLSEYNDTLYTVNSLTNGTNLSNATLSFQGASYASSISTLVTTDHLSSIAYLLHPPSTLQNYAFSGNIYYYSTFTFKEMSESADINVTTQSFDLLPSMRTLTVWLWGGGGSTWSNTSNVSGGAGAYIKATLDVASLLNGGVSTLYIVVGKGGNLDNPSFIPTAGVFYGYEQPRYGGGGTALLKNSSGLDGLALQGGGFTGLFTHSNLLTAQPLLIVGGGGAAGGYHFGGPGGIGLLPPALSTLGVSISSIRTSAIYYSKPSGITLSDLDFNTVYNRNTIGNAADGSLTTFWDPLVPPFMNPVNYSPTANTYRVNVNYSQANSGPLKIRYYGPSFDDVMHLPTGFVVYGNENKLELLYSNTSLKTSDFQVIQNGIFTQWIYEMTPMSTLRTTPSTLSSWIVGGTNSGINQLQYSVNGFNWTPVLTNTSAVTSVQSIQYVDFLNIWYATGTGGFMRSTDGLNWSLALSTTAPVVSLAFGLTVCVALGSDGSVYTTTDGIWIKNTNNLFTTSGTHVRYLNNLFWATGYSATGQRAILHSSPDGLSWAPQTSLVGGVGVSDIAYGLGRYVLVQGNGKAPFYSGILYSFDALTWSAPSQANLGGFSGTSVVFGSSSFVAVGSTTDGTSFIKYSSNGINWTSSSFPSLGDAGRLEVQYVGGQFICVGRGIAASGRAGNQVSILTSQNGITWNYSSTGGFNPDSAAFATCVGFGPVVIPPTTSGFYMEIQKTSNTSFEPYIYEIRPYTNSNVLATSLNPLSDGSLSTIFYPSLQEAEDILEYPFIVNFSSLVNLNTLSLYSGNNSGAFFTGVTVSTDGTPKTIIYQQSNLLPSFFSFNSQMNLNQTILQFAPEVQSVSTLFLSLAKNTPGTLQLNEIQISYDPNLATVVYGPSTITDLDSRASVNPLTSLIDGSVETSWSPGSLALGASIRLNVSFSTLVERVNTMYIYNGLVGSGPLINGIYVYTDSNKTQPLYSNNSAVSRPSMNYNLFDISLQSPGSLSTLYMEFTTSSSGSPVLNELKFLNTGSIAFTSTIGGYAGGALNVMQKTVTAYSLLDGGGGGPTLAGPVVGGVEGEDAFNGSYLTGGSPGESGNYLQTTSFSGIQGGAGGGGGGYYGGGGGGTVSNLGGAGGGGAGFVSTCSFITVIDYGTAFPSANFATPGLQEQSLLLYSNLFPSTQSVYGQGGTSLINSGRGSHGVAVISYESNVGVNPPSSPLVLPSYIDGSKLSLFQSPITYTDDSRNLNFRTYEESIQTTAYAGYNWVWYRSYLLLTGNRLLSSMTASSSVPSFPPSEFPRIPFSTWSTLATQASTVSTLYGTAYSNITFSTITSLASSINQSFSLFQSSFIQTSVSDAHYIEMTEIYCLLDYLRQTSNLSNPHVNPLSSSLDRVFGGLPRFGYWANPFTTNASYLGFDIAPSLLPASQLVRLSGNSNQVTAFYGLIMEQSLSTGIYSFKDVMAYKPSLNDLTTQSAGWAIVSQFAEGYSVRNLADTANLTNNIPVQPYTAPNGISGRYPLFQYKVYTTPLLLGSSTINSPIQVINDFNGEAIYVYTFQNRFQDNLSSINLSPFPFVSTTVQLNQAAITKQANSGGALLGTLVTENPVSSFTQVVTKFGYNGTATVNYTPLISYSSGVNNYYNSYLTSSQLASSNVGKALLDAYGNYYATDNKGGSVLYENICTTKIYQKSFANSNIPYASPGNLRASYQGGAQNPAYDFFFSKTTNIWHVQGGLQMSTLYGARLTSPYDFNITTNFANQVFYPVHKIVLTKKASSLNPITDTTDVTNYPSYPHTEMFFYNNYSTLRKDLYGKFAQENTSNYAYMNMNSGYFFDSYIHNINMSKSDQGNLNPDGFNYLALRAYSPSESFKTLLRFYLPERYDFGYISLNDLSGEILVVSTVINVNPEYKNVLQAFHASFSTTKVFGSTGLPGFSGSNISSSNFGDFLNQYNKINSTINAGSYIASTVNGYVTAAQSNLITGDLRYILPAYLTNRQRVTDPLEFRIPFSTVISSSNARVQEYGLGYNLGFPCEDTGFNTSQRASSFFKILDDYIYLRMNPEYNMNRLDISQPENFSETRDTTAQTQLYNCKLILNNFGTYATTFVQNPVNFSPAIGKLDKLSFYLYNSAGNLINNNECEWTGAIQIVEKVESQA